MKSHEAAFLLEFYVQVQLRIFPFFELKQFENWAGDLFYFGIRT